MKNGNISTENQPPGSARNPEDRLGEGSNDSRDVTGAKKPKPGETTQSNADMSEVVKNVKRRD